MVPKLPDLRVAAKSVLIVAIRPVHYGELARRSLALMGTVSDDREVRMVAEDLREKVLKAGQDGMRYIPRPYCYGILQEWFNGPVLINPDIGLIPVDVTSQLAIDASAEAILRAPYILNKDVKRVQMTEDHARRIARGFLIQMAVSNWAQSLWPSLWLPPLNQGNYERWCDHDFRLQLPASKRTFTVDVAGPHRDNFFGVSRGDKPAADIHILATDEGLTIHIQGVVSDSIFRQQRLPIEQAQPITRFMFYLNCEIIGHTWRELYSALYSQ